jgi:hypothetical protein
MTQPRHQFVSTRHAQRAFATAGANEHFGRNQNLTGFTPSAKLGPVANTVLIVLLIAVLGILYLTQLGKSNTFGYELNDINNQRAALTAEQEDLRVENARLQSLSRVSGSSVAAAMTTPTDTNSAQ